MKANSARIQPKKWYAIDLVVEESACEAGEYGLMEAGALGTETKDARNNALLVSGYFDDHPNREFVRSKLAEALRVYNVPSSSVRQMDLREVPDEDWLAEWKKGWKPIETGHFIIAPPWNDRAVGDNQILITIEPGMAFGTGTHETTRLCLLAIERYYEDGSFLDVGTGTGILAIAAAKLSSDARVEACDTDSEAIAIAKENAQLNGVGERITFHTGTINDSTPSSDFVCANLTADVIVDLMPALLGVTCCRLVLSGILESQVTPVVERALACGSSNPIEIANDGEWSAIIL
jgi:ribosomal protein L11 methyltransferase